MSKHAHFDWEDAFRLDDQLSEGGRMIRDTAAACIGRGIAAF